MSDFAAREIAEGGERAKEIEQRVAERTAVAQPPPSRHKGTEKRVANRAAVAEQKTIRRAVSVRQTAAERAQPPLMSGGRVKGELVVGERTNQDTGLPRERVGSKTELLTHALSPKSQP